MLIAAPAGRLAAMLWTGMLVSLPWILLKTWPTPPGWKFPRGLSPVLALCPIVCVALFGFFWEPHLQSVFQRIWHVMESAFSFLSFVAAINVILFLICWFKARNLNEPRPLHRQAVIGMRPQGPSRVIVILLDELSYDQVYGHRAPDLLLPAFDALASTSSVFTDVRPAASITEIAVPSMLTGLQVTKIAASLDGGALRMGVGNQWVTFEPQNTAFGDALRAGYSTGLAGWYNPYCRLLPEVLDRCFWTSSWELTGLMMVDRDSIGANTLQPVVKLARTIPGMFVHNQGSFRLSMVAEQEQHIDDYHRLSAASDALLLDPTIGFVFLHLPVPHPHGIYDRKQRSLVIAPTTYLDNLALADEYLAHVRQLLQGKGEWDSSAIVVTGDHSWRTWMWNTALTDKEDIAAANRAGGFDDRPGLMVKLPGQTTGNRIDTAFQATHFRKLIDQILTGQLRTGSDLKNSVDAGKL
jgi:hypothetical protein